MHGSRTENDKGGKEGNVAGKKEKEETLNASTEHEPCGNVEACEQDT